MNSEAEEEETGPSVDSADPEERIAARRARIQKRIEAQRRAEMGEDLDSQKEVKEELSKSRKQMEDSRLRLTKLYNDGVELVTNIRVAGDAREGTRRVEEEENRRQRKERLDAEAKAGSERFEEITRKWESALQKEIPQDLHEMLMLQKQSCDAMIYEKNKLITDFQTELKSKDDVYVKDLKKQAEDIDLMIERMDEQVKELTKAFRDEAEQIEKSFVAERTELFDHHKTKWEQTMQARTDRELEFMKSREKRVEDYEQQLQHLRVQDAEEYNMVKIKMETDIQVLQQQLQQMKATYQLNQEKLEYNFQVLRKRDEENTITKSQQKRKITRLQDVLTNLKNKLARQEKAFREDNQMLTEDYKRITEQFKELQKKSKHFMEVDSKKFHDVWVMNEEEAKELVKKVMEQDRMLHEQQLGLDWQPPDLSFMDNEGPILSDLQKKKQVTAKQVVREVMSAATGAEGNEETMSEKAASRRSLLLQKFSPKLIKDMLELLCEETDFLIESKLQKLLQPLESDEQSLMRLDAIFSALGVESDEDINMLATYFAIVKESFVIHDDKEEGEEETKKESEETEGSESEEKVMDSEKMDDHVTDDQAASTTKLEGPTKESDKIEDKTEDPAKVESEAKEPAKVEGQAEEHEKMKSRSPSAKVRIQSADSVRFKDVSTDSVKVKDQSTESAKVEGQSAETVQTEGATETSEKSEGDVAKEKSLISEPSGITDVESFIPTSARNKDLIHPNDVLKALRHFVEDSKSSKGDKGGKAGHHVKTTQFKIANVVERDDTDDAKYWSRYPAVLTHEEENLWDSTLDGLDKYHDNLQTRATLINETDSLRQQNAELRMLLHQYVNSKVNQELEIPPTRVLQLEMNPPQ